MTQMQRRAVLVAVGGGAASAAAGVVLARARWETEPAPGRPVQTSFGSVTVLGSSRVGTTTAGGDQGGHGGGSGHGGHASPASNQAAPPTGDLLVASSAHGAWSSGVLVEVRAHNRLRAPVALSPGQFRVRVASGGPTVSLYSSDLEAAPLEPGATRTLRITYLAPPPDRGLSLEFDDTGSSALLDLGRVGRPTANGVWS